MMVELLNRRSTRADLRSRLQRMLGSDSHLGTCRWDRVRIRPGRGARVWMTASVTEASTTHNRSVMAEWGEVGEVFDTGRCVAQPHSAAPFDRLIDDGDPRVAVSPYDPSHPDLAALLDPAEVADRLGVSSRLGPRIETVRYRPGERHVLRYQFSSEDGAGQWARYAKVTLPGEAVERFAHAMSFSEGVRAAGGPQVIRPSDLIGDAVVYPATGGLPISKLEPADVRTVAEQLDAAGAALAGIHRARLEAVTTSRTIEEELRITSRAVRVIHALLPSLSADLTAMLERLEQRAQGGDSEPVVVLHGDMKLDHLHRCHGGLVIIDTDRAGRGETALDIGNLLADVWWWLRREPDSRRTMARTAVLDGYGTVDGPRIRIVEALALLRIASRRAPILDVRWANDIRTAVKAAATLTNSVAGRSPLVRRR